MILKSGPNLDKRCVWLSDTAPSHEILKKNIFCCKTFKKVLKRGAEILSALFCKKCPFLLTLDAVQIF